MTSYGADIQGLHYNAAEQSYEARVIFHEGADRVTYPVDLNVPITADFAAVSRGLVLRARAMRAQDRGANLAHLKLTATQAAQHGRLERMRHT
nr:hypothetical protein [uncultured Celeribacter sp.]